MQLYRYKQDNIILGNCKMPITLFRGKEKVAMNKMMRRHYDNMMYSVFVMGMDWMSGEVYVTCATPFF